MKDIVGELLGKDIKATLMCDSQSAIHLAKNQAHHERIKHIHFLERKEVDLIKVADEDNVVDIFTKAVSMAKLHHCLRLL